MLDAFEFLSLDLFFTLLSLRLGAADFSFLRPLHESKIITALLIRQPHIAHLQWFSCILARAYSLQDADRSIFMVATRLKIVETPRLRKVILLPDRRARIILDTGPLTDLHVLLICPRVDPQWSLVIVDKLRFLHPEQPIHEVLPLHECGKTQFQVAFLLRGRVVVLLT